MMKILVIGIGGFFGAIARYGLSGLVYRFIRQPTLPYGTLTVNIVGCFFIGFLGGLSESKQILTPQTRALLFIGFLGGFTTFSTFLWEIFNTLRAGQIATSMLNLALHLILGMLFLWLGFVLSRTI